MANFAVGENERAVKPSLRDQAYQQIKDLIITGELTQGEYLNEAELVQRLGIGRTPINQALHRLSLENLVVTMPRKGLYVKPLSSIELRQITEVRRINECYAARLAALHATDKDVKAMHACLEFAKANLQTGDTRGFLSADKTFHTLLVASAKNPTLQEILSQLHDQSQRYWFVSLESAGQMNAVQTEHEAIVQAIEAGDPDAAEAAMMAHIKSLENNMTDRV